MPGTTLLLIVVGLLVAGLVVFRQWKLYRIRRTGTCVMAKVIQVHSWQEPSRGLDVSPQVSLIPLTGARCQYEIVAEGRDPRTGETLLITSGMKKGLARYKQGEYLPAYLSSKGNYLEL